MIDRRNFIQNATLGAIALAGVGTLAGCSTASDADALGTLQTDNRQSSDSTIELASMQTLMATFCNATSEDTEEEMNNWYTWVHIQDVMSMKGSTRAVQRFERAASQPKNADTRHKFVALYEVVDKDVCTDLHMSWTGSLKLEISPAFDLSSFTEAYWDPALATANFEDNADNSGDRTVLVVRLDGDVESTISQDTLNDLASRDGFKAAHLFRHGDNQMPTSAVDSEKGSHMLVAQLDNAATAAQTWDEFAELLELDSFGANPVIFSPIIPRIIAADRIKSPEWRALTFLSHAILNTSDKAKAYPSSK